MPCRVHSRITPKLQLVVLPNPGVTVSTPTGQHVAALGKVNGDDYKHRD